MKRTSMVCLFLLLFAASLIGGGTAPADAGPTGGSADLQPVATSGCFPIDECNICCPLPDGGLICTQRICS